MKLGIKRDCCTLTLEELRNMNGKPVWVKCCNPQKYISPPIGWRILEKSVTGHFGVWDGESCLTEHDYGTDWFAYAYEPIKIDRSKWEPCQFCRTKNRIHLGFDGYDDAISIVTDNNSAAIESDSFEFIVSYCPMCGRPLTEQAWKELERKMFGK